MKTTKPFDIGTGVLNWDRGERVSDRYGTVVLFADEIWSTRSTLQARRLRSRLGRHGALVATVLETRPSRHIGDFFRGFRPGGASVGQRIRLGTGRLFVEVTADGNTAVGLQPDDGRERDWLDPRALYRCHDQTVRLTFEPAGTP